MDQNLASILDQFGDPNRIKKSLGEYLEDQLRTLLQKGIDQAGFNGTGRLRGSIVVTYDENANTLSIGMQSYGIYQNYGVLGYDGNDRGTEDVEEFWGLQPSRGRRFQYGVGAPGWRGMRKFGLKARRWIPTEDDLLLLVDDFIEQYKTMNDETV